MKKFINTWTSLCGAGLLLFALASCGDYFAQEFPDEYDPDKKPYITGINMQGSLVMYEGDKREVLNGALRISNGKSLADQEKDDRDYLLSSLAWTTENGGTVVTAERVDKTYKPAGNYGYWSYSSNQFPYLFITAKGPGDEDIVAYDADGKEVIRWNVVVVDPNAPPKEIKINRVIFVIQAGETIDDIRDYVEFQPSYTQNRNLVWSSDDTSVATVDEYGNVTGVSTGTAIITAAARDNPAVYGTTMVVVMPNQEEMYKSYYRYETIVYAKIIIDGETPMEGFAAYATCGNEYRGANRTVISHNYNWNTGEWYVEWFYNVFRIGSNSPRGETIKFSGYNARTHSYIDFDESIQFNNDVYGTMSNPFILHGTTRPVEEIRK